MGEPQLGQGRLKRPWDEETMSGAEGGDCFGEGRRGVGVEAVHPELEDFLRVAV